MRQTGVDIVEDQLYCRTPNPTCDNPRYQSSQRHCSLNCGNLERAIVSAQQDIGHLGPARRPYTRLVSQLQLCLDLTFAVLDTCAVCVDVSSTMASKDAAETTAEEHRTEPRDITNLSERTDEAPSSTPLEMSSLATKSEAFPASSQAEQTQPSQAATSETVHDITTQEPSAPSSSDQTAAPTPRLSRLQSTAIGPSSDADLPIPSSKDATNESAGPTLLMTLLLTNGARHPFKLDSKYLAKRLVTVQNNDPFNLSVYKLKELILREWRDEWEAKPTSPSSIRLISFGKLLDDKGVLRGRKYLRCSWCRNHY